MFGIQFYPTPKALIKKMMEPYFNLRGDISLDGKAILEPSAGKGDILDYIKEKAGRYNQPKLYAIEQDPELQMIIVGKQYRMLADDFLAFDSPYQFDLIVMNPPFGAGSTHLLKAWDIMVNGDIVCLLNAETYTNPSTKERQLLKHIIDTNGTVEHVGAPFADSDSERKTDVETILVRLTKVTEAAQDTIDTSGMDKDRMQFPDDLQENQIAVTDTLLAYEHRYNATVQTFLSMQKEVRRFMEYAKPFKGNGENYLKQAMESSPNEFISDLNHHAWNVILMQSKFQSFLTAGVRKEFDEKFKSQQSMQFTKKNMLVLFNILWQNKSRYLEQGIEEVFDTFTKYHEENRVHIEGWKTNDAWKVNKKVILPFYVEYGQYMSADAIRRSGDRFRLNFSKSQELIDVDRAMGYLMGEQLENVVTVCDAVEAHFKMLGTVKGNDFDKDLESTYFKIRFYKKGTLHIIFKDNWLWEEFNLRATKSKTWLPPGKANKYKKPKATALARVA